MKLTLTLPLLMMLACACSRQETQKTLTRRLSEADRVIIADKFPDQHGFAMPLSAEEANRLGKAIANAKRESGVITASPELRITFFKGTNLLGAFDAGGVGVFWIDHGPDPRGRPGLRRVVNYVDSTGTLETLGQKFRQQKDAQPNSQ